MSKKITNEIINASNLSNKIDIDIERKTTEDIKKIFVNLLVSDIKRRKNYKRYWDLFKNGIVLDDNEYGTHRIELKLATRMCKAHASYVLKDRPNIQIPPINPEVYELKQHAARIEKALNIWWTDQNIFQTLKKGTLKACVKGDHIYYLSIDSNKKRIYLNTLDPEFFNYETVSNDPTSSLAHTIRGDLVLIDILKKSYPKFADQIIPTNSVAQFNLISGFSLTDMFDSRRAMFIEVMDQKYIYRYINDIEVEVVEHKLPFIPVYIQKYFDWGEKWGESLMSFCEDPIKFINMLLGYKADIALKTSNPPLIISGGNAQIDASSLKGGKIQLPTGTAMYLQPPKAPIDLDQLLTIMKAFMHFLTGISEEAMAGFVGALTAAGVSIELRLDSTVREALDMQSNLQVLIQRMNRDWLFLNEKFFPKTDLFNSEFYGKISDIAFNASEVNKYYLNIVDFGGILPRSADQIVRNVIAKKQSNLISRDTALEELRYMDPTTEINKIYAENGKEAEVLRQIQSGGIVEKKFFDNPKQEEDYMLTQNKLALVHPSQNHNEHIESHKNRLQQVQSPLLIQHLIMHQNYLKNELTATVPPPQQFQNGGQFQGENSYPSATPQFAGANQQQQRY
jgi:hypothetical protein